MSFQPNSLLQVDAELIAPVATAQLVRFHFAEPIDHTSAEDDNYRLDLCLTPRPGNARACYPNHWNASRFERIGNLFLLPPGEPLRTRSDGCCEQSSMIFHINSEKIQALFEEELHWTDRRLLASLDVRDANIHSLMTRLVQEAKQPGFASDMLVELISAQIAIELTRYCTGADETAVQGGLAGWRLRVIEERLREVREAPTLQELADLCRLSVRQMTRGFRASKGFSIGDYVAESRVEHAKLLLASDQSVKAIAYTLGFASPSSFCYAFRRATGATPGQYRQRLMKLH